MIEKNYLNLPEQFKNIKLYDYVIMPNHIHGIIEICEYGNLLINQKNKLEIYKNQRADMESAPTINKIVQTFKRYTTIEYIKGVKEGKYKPFNKRIWQRGYYEHIIRNKQDYLRICNYIKQNPQKWNQP